MRVRSLEKLNTDSNFEEEFFLESLSHQTHCRYVTTMIQAQSVDAKIFERSDYDCAHYMIAFFVVSFPVKRSGNMISLKQQGSQTARSRKIKTNGSRGIHGVIPKAVK